jgi:hypothetical protein
MCPVDELFKNVSIEVNLTNIVRADDKINEMAGDFFPCNLKYASFLLFKAVVASICF